MKSIKLSYIEKIQKATMRIFEAEDEDYPDRRIVSINNRAIQHWLEKITSNVDEQNVILTIIKNNNFNDKDLTFKPICDELRKEGYEIIEEEV